MRWNDDIGGIGGLADFISSSGIGRFRGRHDTDLVVGAPVRAEESPRA